MYKYFESHSSEKEHVPVECMYLSNQGRPVDILAGFSNGTNGIRDGTNSKAHKQFSYRNIGNSL